MNRNNIVDTLGEILSIAHHYQYKNEVIESRIAHSEYFTTVEQNIDAPSLYMSSSHLFAAIFYDIKIDGKIEIYNQALWAAELYLRIQETTHFTFEGIFLYLPLSKVYELYPVYHEMDFSQAVKYFMSLQKSQSILSIAMRKNKVSSNELAKVASLSYPTISALRQQTRDISKLQARALYKISTYLHLRLETLLG